MPTKPNQSQKPLARFCSAALLVAGVLAPTLLPLAVHAQIPAPTPTPSPQTLALLEAGKFKVAGCGTFELICHLRTGIGELLVWLGLTANRIAGALLQFFANIIGFLFALTSELFTFDMVTIGFQQSLLLVNLGFVLALILIAFATMLRIESYGMKAFLGKLVLAVILVNFSFTIAGLFIDFSHKISAAFLTGGSPLSAVGTNITRAIGAHRLIVAQTSDTTNDVGIAGAPYFKFNDWGSIMKMLIVVFFIFLMLTLAVIVMGAIALMVLIRLIALSILIILMPPAWLGWATPRLTNIWDSWWNSFLKWNFFLPAMSFFIFLVTQTGKNLQDKVAAGIAGTGGGSTQAKVLDDAINIPGFTGIALQAIIILGLLVGGLMAAQSFGLAGAAAGMNAARGLKNRLVSGARGTGRLGLRGAKLAGRTAGKPFVRPGRAAARGLSTAMTKLSTLPVIRRIPGMKAGANKLAGIGSRKSDVEQYQEANYSKLSDEQVKTHLKAKPPPGQAAKVALLKEAMKRKLVDDAPDENLVQLRSAAEGAKGSDAAKEFAKFRPDMAPDVPGTVKKISPPDVHFTARAIQKLNAEVVVQMNNGQFSAILARGSEQEQKALTEKLMEILDRATSSKSIDVTFAAKNKDNVERINKFIDDAPAMRTYAGLVGSSSTPPPAGTGGKI